MKKMPRLNQAKTGYLVQAFSDDGSVLPTERDRSWLFEKLAETVVRQDYELLALSVIANGYRMVIGRKTQGAIKSANELEIKRQEEEEQENGSGAGKSSGVPGHADGFLPTGLGRLLSELRAVHQHVIQATDQGAARVLFEEGKKGFPKTPFLQALPDLSSLVYWMGLSELLPVLSGAVAKKETCETCLSGWKATEAQPFNQNLSLLSGFVKWKRLKKPAFQKQYFKGYMAYLRKGLKQEGVGILDLPEGLSSLLPELRFEGFVKKNPSGILGQRRKRMILLLLFLLVAGSLGWFGYQEMISSTYQARYFHEISKKMTFELKEGPSDQIHFPEFGPYDKRLGYVALPKISKKLLESGFEIESQARMSDEMKAWTERGVFPIYDEKNQTGLKIADESGNAIYSSAFPIRVFDRFETTPRLVVDTLLFIESREILKPESPKLNPAVEWDRFGRAILEKGMQLVDPSRNAPGGSTLATQMVKFRHSPNGFTNSSRDKIMQMLTASFRAYHESEDTLEARRKIVLDYINSVPLAAVANYGEVNGLGDGLWVWYGADLLEVSAQLKGDEQDEAALKAKALALKQVLSLFIAHKRPSFFLLEDRQVLRERCNSYLRLLMNEGLISKRLRDAALETELVFRPGAPPVPVIPMRTRKAVNVLRTRLMPLLGLDRLYEIDRMDLEVKGTIHEPVQGAVTDKLLSLRKSEVVDQYGFRSERLLAKGDPAKVVYSLTLYERGEGGNILRVQTDTFEKQLNINEGMKLDLGSTAKMRTLVTYLEVFAKLHGKLSGLNGEQLRELGDQSEDALSSWSIAYFKEHAKVDLERFLRAAMERKYSGNTGEGFFTGGGLHYFQNFDKNDNRRILTVWQGLRSSTNLVFVRMMRDIVNYYIYNTDKIPAKEWRRADNPDRQIYLARFAEYEGAEYLRQFYRKLKGKDPEIVVKEIADTKQAVYRIACMYRYIFPRKSLEEMSAFILANAPETKKDFQELYDQYAPGKYSLADLGYIAKVHPLELWMLAYLQEHPQADFEEILNKSKPIRIEVYNWLFRPSKKKAQDQRIRTLLEMEAFIEIHQAWKRLGYPFDSLVPSYATAIGSSSDRPAALADLVGILMNEGIKYPNYRIQSLHFGKDTPYETLYERKPVAGERLLPEVLAKVVREGLYGVVEAGTAQRIKNALQLPDGSYARIGGKTGTGDNRYETFGAGGRLLESRAVNRTATFAFMLGNHFFGTITVFVLGEEADDYQFTSSLPVAVLKALLPELAPMVVAREMVKANAVPKREEGEREKGGAVLARQEVAPSANEVRDLGQEPQKEE